MDKVTDSERQRFRNIRGCKVASFLMVFAFTASPAMADWDYVSSDQMIKGADVIAIVNIGPIQNTNAPEKSLEFHQMAQASVEQTLKGTLPKTITIYGGINCKGFVACVPDVSLSSGRSLVFLRRKHDEANGFISANADRGIEKITNDSVIWHDEHDGPNRAGKQLTLSAVSALVKSK